MGMVAILFNSVEPSEQTANIPLTEDSTCMWNLVKVGQNSLKKTFKDYMILNIYGIGSKTTKGENRGETTRREMTTVLSTSLQDRFFTWCFILNGNIDFWLTVSYQKPFIVSVHVLCFQIFTAKLILWPKNGSDLGNFYSKLEFWKIFIKKIFFAFFLDHDFKLFMFHN